MRHVFSLCGFGLGKLIGCGKITTSTRGPGGRVGTIYSGVKFGYMGTPHIIQKFTKARDSWCRLKLIHLHKWKCSESYYSTNTKNPEPEIYMWPRVCGSTWVTWREHWESLIVVEIFGFNISIRGLELCLVGIFGDESTLNVEGCRCLLDFLPWLPWIPKPKGIYTTIDLHKLELCSV